MYNVFLSFIGKNDLNFISDPKKNSKREGALVFILKKLQSNVSDANIINDFTEEYCKEKFNVNYKQIEENIKEIFPQIKFKFFYARKLISNYNPMNYSKINDLIDIVINKNINVKYFINLTSGTPAIISILLLLSKSKLNADLYTSFYDEKIKKEVFEKPNIPFNISFTKINKTIDKGLQSSEIIGKSPKLKEAIQKAIRVAKYDISCLILGESGTGKELIAQEIMDQNIRKGDKTNFNCSLLSAELARSELFGYQKGAFTGASKDKDGIIKKNNGGMLFLDEIGDLPIEVQTQLLRFIQEGTFTPIGGTKEEKADVRIIAATNKDINKMIKEEKFRADLFYRLAIEVIELPPLRERKEDIPLLVEFFLNKINNEFKNSKYIIEHSPKKINEEAMNELIEYDWPGNVRELQNTIKRAIILSDVDIIDKDVIKKAIYKFNIQAKVTDDNRFPMNLKMHLRDYEKKIILKALIKTKFKQKDAAILLGMDNTTLNKKIKDYKIKEEKV